MSNTVKVFEYSTLAVGGAFTESQFDRLTQYNERHGNKYFAVGYNRIHFRNYVGVIQVGNLTIEILPKADTAPGTKADKDKWQAVLIEMIRQSGFVRLATLSDARLRIHSASLLDICFESFLAEVAGLTHRGLVRKYRQSRDNLTTLKGRLMFQEHISRNMIHREHFFTEYVYYDRNNPFNQILKVALDVLSKISTNRHLAASARNLSLSFQDVQDIRINQETFDRLRYTHNTERYRRAIQLAKLIILNYNPDIRSGQENVLAILFDMNTLFERYVYVQLKRAESNRPDRDIIFKPQVSRRYWQAGDIQKYIRPDIIAQIDKGHDKENVILDTKWKLPSDGKPADADLHQMHTYNIQFGSLRSLLLYPKVSRTSDIYGTFTEPALAEVSSPHSCGMIFLELFEDGAAGKLKKDLGGAIIKQIISCSEPYSDE